MGFQEMEKEGVCFNCGAKCTRADYCETCADFVCEDCHDDFDHDYGDDLEDG
jgi:hypothetical protein